MDDILQIRHAFEQSWSAKTSVCFSPDAFPSYGQCAQTAIIVQEIFGGEILKTTGWHGSGLHFYNRIDGVRYDFTVDQFSMPGYSYKLLYEDYQSDFSEAEKETLPGQLAALKYAFLKAYNSKSSLSIKSAILSATKLLNNEEAALEAKLLLQHLLGVNRAWLIAHENDALEDNIHEAFEALIKRRLNGEPIAYIFGYREFYGLKLKVTPDTLIPRPDTETLVEAALGKIPQNKKIQVLDLGTGTGAIALAIAHNRPHALVSALDASDAALKIAQENAQNLAITNIEFLQSDWYSALKNQTFDVIVSNPPYIAQNDAHLTQGDLRFEPASALASGADGLDDIKQIIANAPKYLTPHGVLLLEHGYNQAEEVATLLKQSGFSEIETIKDLGGNNRVTLGMMPR